MWPYNYPDQRDIQGDAMLEPELKQLTPKTLAGMHVTMSLAANRFQV
jgi:hypothetical protein